LVLAACGTDDPAVVADLPADYRATFTEVRDCRSSGDHDLHKIRILADPAALEPYMTRAMPFPKDAVVVKEEYDFSDADCAGELIEFTVMKKTNEADFLGWNWQRLTPAREVATQNEDRCIACHDFCGAPPDGHDGTCALP
jgi:hypothetical protein